MRTAHPSDEGRLLLGLDALRRARPALEGRIRRLLERYDLSTVARDRYFAQADLYAIYSVGGFRRWRYETPEPVSIAGLGGGESVKVFDEEMPRVYLTSEPLLHALLESGPEDPPLRALADKLYRAQERRHRATGRWTAWSEGAMPRPPSYAYEWIVTGDGRVWTVLDVDGLPIDDFEIAYAKAAFAYHALYDTAYTRALTAAMAPLASAGGFREGLADGRPVEVLTDKTNSLILEAAAYAAEHPR
jgi:hypothetical protein